MKKYFPRVNNYKMTRCTKCGTRIVGKWWIQIGHRVWCINHYKIGIKQEKNGKSRKNKDKRRAQ